MRATYKLLLISFGSLLCGCDKPETSSSVDTVAQRIKEFLRLHSHGGWGIDGDIWIYPDDTFQVRSYDAFSGEIIEERHGSRKGVFREIVSLADSENAWEITTRSLDNEIQKAFEDGSILGVTDSDHVFLEFRLPDRTLVADFYASDSFAKEYPMASQVGTFAVLEHAMYTSTKER